MSYNIDDSDATKIFVSRSNREFSQEFLGRKTTHDIEHEKKIREFTLRIAEAEAAYLEQKKLVNLARTEARELRVGQQEAFDKYQK
uniref:Uncharacterized protein n=1 Tax=Panagrolaimus sp. JU765 TaxID=591449 RepID=A0AC34RSF8_9BILA